MIPITERLAEALRSCVQQLRDQQAMPDDSGYAEYETALAEYDRLRTHPAEGGEGLARRFHEIYERLAPSFGYETRKETREFDPTTPNGRLMIAVCSEIAAAPPPPAPTFRDPTIEDADKPMLIRRKAIERGNPGYGRHGTCSPRSTRSAPRWGRSVGLQLTPISLREANAFVAANHRHHKPVRGCISCVAVSCDDKVNGVAIVGRPLARMLQDGYTAEVLRCCTDGTRNACSMLYRAAWRSVRALGYRRLVTYTLPEEGGASLRAAGMICLGTAGGGSWSRKDRPRVDLHPTQEKLRWEIQA